MVFIPRIVFHISDFDASKKKIVTNPNGKSTCTILDGSMTKTFLKNIHFAMNLAIHIEI